ncbi:hypothetical protein [Streptomyces sp. NPDC056387]|uniref:hypothetical protein n=1 Tax=Streptomyces sp. NPDC056387 TaxID=3345803 RepID=UPI0035E022EC
MRSGFHGVQFGVGTCVGAGGGWGPRFGFWGTLDAPAGGGDFGRAPGVAPGSGVSSGSVEAAGGVVVGAGVGAPGAGEPGGVGLALGAGGCAGPGAGNAPAEQPVSSRAPASSAVTDIGTLPWGLTPTGHLLER